MSGLRMKIMIAFLGLGGLTILSLGIVVNWKIGNSTDQQVRLVKNVVGAEADERLRGHLNILEAELADMARANVAVTRSLTQRPDLGIYLEKNHRVAVSQIIEAASQDDALEFGLVFDLKGQLVGSFPDVDGEFDLFGRLAGTGFDQRVRRILDAAGSDIALITNATVRLNDGFFANFGSGARAGIENGALTMIAAAQITDDFDDPIGLLVTGRILNNDIAPLTSLNEMTGSAYAIYLDTVPISSAGFEGAAPHLPRGVRDALNQSAATDPVLNPTVGRYLTACTPIRSDGALLGATLCTANLQSEILKAQDRMAAFGIDTRKSVQFSIVIVGVIALILIGLVSLLIATRISAPLRAMTMAMQHLAGGNTDVDIPAATGTDEVADMARAVAVFRESMLRNDELQAMQAEERRAKEERAERIAGLSGGFDAKAREVLQTVSSAATELRQTAESMSAIA
ncbi:MAG: HAMP domain-containing protein, partial [Rhodospirillales bacterium]